MTTMTTARQQLVLPEATAWFTGPLPTPAIQSPDGFVAPPESFLYRPLFESIAEVARRAPDALALRSGTRQVSYGNLHAQALALAGRIGKLCRPGGAVAVLATDELDLPRAMLACLAAGCICIPVQSSLPPARVAAILQDAMADVLILSIGSPVPEIANPPPILWGTEEEAGPPRAFPGS